MDTQTRRKTKSVESICAPVECTRAKKAKTVDSHEASVGLTQLPVELVLLVFRFLDPQSLLHAVQVNSRWHAIVQEYGHELWHRACLRMWNVDDNDVLLCVQSWKAACLRSSSMQAALSLTAQVAEAVALDSDHVLCKPATPQSVSLNLACLNLVALPKQLFSLIQLRVLNLSFNQLMQVPSEIGCLTNLEWLVLSGNHIRKIPSEISALGNLQSLHLDNNELTQISAQPFLGLTNLKELHLKHNQIVKISSQLHALPSLHAIFIQGNPLKRVSALIVNKCVVK
jgi:Leucine-rich repeat (LRR) protein